MKNAITIEYGDAGKGHFSEPVTSFNELVKRLGVIGKEYRELLKMPYAVDLVQNTGERLSVGLGNGKWILTYFPASDSASVLNSLGDESAEGTVIFHFGQWSELSNKYLVPREHALQVIQSWVEKGILDDVIRWTDKIYWI